MKKASLQITAPLQSFDAKGPAPNEPFDRNLVAAFIAGNQNAFNAIFQCLKSDIFRQIKRFFYGAFEQEEAFQEVWLHIYRMRHHFDVKRSAEFRAWAYQVTRNRCIDLLKARGRRMEIPCEEMDVPFSASQQETFETRQLQQLIGEITAKFSEEERKYFELCFVQELSHEEIAQQLSITIRRSKYLKKKFLARLMKIAPIKRIVGQ